MSSLEIPADWEKWAHMLTARVWEAVALSMDIEPGEVSGIDFRPIAGDVFDDCPREFRRRLDIAANHIKGSNLPYTGFTLDPRYSEVRLTVFATWAQSLGWSLPDRFPREPTPVGNPASPGGRARGPKTGKTEAVAAEILAQLKTGSLTPCSLHSAKEVAMAAQFNVSRDTYRKARDKALSDFVEATKSDK